MKGTLAQSVIDELNTAGVLRMDTDKGYGYLVHNNYARLGLYLRDCVRDETRQAYDDPSEVVQLRAGA